MLSVGTGLKAAEADQQELAAANAGFAFRLLKELAAEQPRANQFISPFSISSLLEMVENGARGHTRDEFQQVLGTAALSPEQINTGYESLSQSISSAQSNAVLNIANALWYRADAGLNPEFAALNKRYYGATVAGVDFSDARSVEAMNAWAAENTHGRIQSIIQPPIPRGTAIVLANAIYFKGTWLKPFDPKQTKERAFYLANGGSKQLPMMLQTRTFLYQQRAGFQAVQLAYVGQRLQMQILLPDTNSSVEALLGQLDDRSWLQTILPGFHDNRGTLILPRFKLRYGAELSKPLVALGLRSAFGGGADFSGMSSSRLFLSQVKHQSFVEVNEEGTEAAATTTGMMALTAFRNPQEPFQMVVDRPFLFVISDQSTKSILFLGVVFDPG